MANQMVTCPMTSRDPTAGAPVHGRPGGGCFNCERSADSTTGIGDGGAGGARVPSIRQKYFFWKLLCKIWSFFGQNGVNFGNFVNFLYMFFFGQKCLSPHPLS